MGCNRKVSPGRTINSAGKLPKWTCDVAALETLSPGEMSFSPPKTVYKRTFNIHKYTCWGVWNVSHSGANVLPCIPKIRVAQNSYQPSLPPPFPPTPDSYQQWRNLFDVFDGGETLNGCIIVIDLRVWKYDLCERYEFGYLRMHLWGSICTSGTNTKQTLCKCKNLL